MSKSPEDDTASQATERGKTRGSQALRETDGGQEQVGEEEREAAEEWGRKEKETQHTKGNIKQCPQIIKATWERYKAIK